MTTDIHSAVHQPSPEFRDFLESEVVREFRRNRTFRRLRAAAVIMVSVGIGMSATLASAQVRENAQKDSVLQAAKAEAMLAAMRHTIARAQYDEQQKQVAVGAMASSGLADAEAQLATSEYEVARTILNIREIEATGLPIRDDLNAPLVKGEDFVKARLDRRAMVADRRLRSAEQRRADVARRVAVGAAQQGVLAEADLEVARARADLVALAEQLRARAKYLKDGTPIEELMKDVDRVVLQQQVVVAQQALRNARATLTVLERQRDAGAVTEVEVLRGRLEVAERELELQRLADRLQKMRDGK